MACRGRMRARSKKKSTFICSNKNRRVKSGMDVINYRIGQADDI